MQESKPQNPMRLWLPFLVDIVAPFLAYLIASEFGAKGVWALTAGGIVAIVTTTVNTIRRKGLDSVGGLVVAEIGVSIALMIFLRDPRLMLIRPSFYTGCAAVYLMFSAFAERPVSFAGSRPMAAKGGPERLAAFERAWERSAEFRRTHRFLTFGFGVGLGLDSILRVIIVYSNSVARAAWLSNVPHTVAIVLMVALSAMAGRRFSRLVDEQMPAAGVGN
ncbi:MAG TPA: VC0807 family protein [Bryobacteraceae bacterium]|nr:VC0807 family protein [Bryobacteraceae bacterium]